MKSKFFALILILAISSCSSKDEFNDSEIFEEYFEEWGITVPYQDVSNLKTYHLLEKLIDNLCLRESYHFWSSYAYTLSQTDVNNCLQNNEAATAFFKRKDCMLVLQSTYLTSLKTERFLTKDYSDDITCTGCPRSFWFFSIETLLSSDMVMSMMNVTNKSQMMVLALESAKYVEEFSLPLSRSFTIMICIMLSSNYTPFVNDVKPMLIDCGPLGYCLRMNDYTAFLGYDDCDTQFTDLIISYAKQFINDNK